MALRWRWRRTINRRRCTAIPTRARNQTWELIRSLFPAKSAKNGSIAWIINSLISSAYTGHYGLFPHSAAALRLIFAEQRRPGADLVSAADAMRTTPPPCRSRHVPEQNPAGVPPKGHDLPSSVCFRRRICSFLRLSRPMMSSPDSRIRSICCYDKPLTSGHLASAELPRATDWT